MRKYSYSPDPRFAVGPDGSTIDLIRKDPKFSELKEKISQRIKISPAGPVDLSQYCISMDQGPEESCTGNGTCEALEMLENMAHTGHDNYQPVLLSRMFVWAMARTQEGTLSQDVGVYFRTVYEVLQNIGVCTEKTWPYDANLVTVSPSLEAQQEALGHTIQAAYRIDTLGNDRLQDIQTSLRAGYPVVFGTQVTQAFEELNSTNYTIDAPSSSTPLLGGHCLVIVGFDENSFTIKNSWGTSWGNNGFCKMTPAYLTWENTTDLWVPTLAPTNF